MLKGTETLPTTGSQNNGLTLLNLYHFNAITAKDTELLTQLVSSQKVDSNFQQKSLTLNKQLFELKEHSQSAYENNRSALVSLTSDSKFCGTLNKLMLEEGFGAQN